MSGPPATANLSSLASSSGKGYPAEPNDERLALFLMVRRSSNAREQSTVCARKLLLDLG
jgi:hypothetical protein